jgi:hypothetical protein
MLSWTSVVLASIVPAVSGLVAVIRHRMTLSFLRHVFDRTGDRKDLEIAGKVIAPGWTAITEGRRREASSGLSRAQLRRLPLPRSTTAEGGPNPRLGSVTRPDNTHR